MSTVGISRETGEDRSDPVVIWQLSPEGTALGDLGEKAGPLVFWMKTSR